MGPEEDRPRRRPVQMMSRSPLRLVVVLAVLALAAPTASADPAKCQKTLLAGLRKYKKTYAKKAWEKCLDAENAGKIPGPCPFTAPIVAAVAKINPKIDAACSPTDLAALGYPSNCMLATAETAAETTCSGLPA